MCPIVTTTNYVKLSGLKQHKCILLEFWRSEVKLGLTWLKSRCQQGCVPSGGCAPCLLQLPDATHIPWL